MYNINFYSHFVDIAFTKLNLDRKAYYVKFTNSVCIYIYI